MAGWTLNKKVIFIYIIKVPQFILDSSVDAGKTCRVVVTQPRRIAAISGKKLICLEIN